MGRTAAHFFCPAPCCPGEGRKRTNIIKFQIQSQFQRFLNKNSYVSSQMTYQIGFSFRLLGHAPGMGLGGTWVNNLFYEIQPHLACSTAQCFRYSAPGALRMSKKVNYHLFHLQSQFQRFLNQTLCFFSQMQDIKHITRVDVSLIWSTWSYPRVEVRSAEGSSI